MKRTPDLLPWLWAPSLKLYPPVYRCSCDWPQARRFAEFATWHNRHGFLARPELCHLFAKVRSHYCTRRLKFGETKLELASRSVWPWRACLFELLELALTVTRCSLCRVITTLKTRLLRYPLLQRPLHTSDWKGSLVSNKSPWRCPHRLTNLELRNNFAASQAMRCVLRGIQLKRGTWSELSGLRSTSWQRSCALIVLHHLLSYMNFRWVQRRRIEHLPIDEHRQSHLQASLGSLRLWSVTY